MRASSQALTLPSAEDAYGVLSEQLAAGHAVVLRSSLEGTEDTDTAILPSDAQALASFKLRLDALRLDLRARLDRLRAELPHRLGFETLGAQLLQAGWLVEIAPGVWKLPGKGTKREARAVFHVAYHAVSAECERYLVQAFSRLEHLQENVAKKWHERPLPGNRARMLPLLEEGTRDAFLGRINRWRVRMPILMEQAFCERILPWDRLEGRSAEELFARLGSAWERTGESGAGVCAYGIAAVDFCQCLLDALLAASERRWALFLLGEGFLQPQTPDEGTK